MVTSLRHAEARHEQGKAVRKQQERGEAAQASAFVPAEENVLRVPHVAVDNQRDPQVLAQTVGDQPVGEDLLAVLALSRVNSDGSGAC